MNPQAAPWLFVSYGGGHVKALLPVAVSVAIENTAVNVESGAVLKAAET